MISCSKEAKDDNPQEPPSTLRSGLIAHYSFNGNTNDESGNGYHLISNGATLSNDRGGNANKAYFFNGINAYMLIPLMPKANLLDSFTISLWLRPHILTNTQAEVLNFKPYDEPSNGLGLNVSNQIQLIKPTSSATYRFHAALYVCEFSPFNVSCGGIGVGDQFTNTENQWKHIVWAKSGRNLFLYVDGQKFTSLANKDVSVSFGWGGKIGVFRVQDIYYFKGDLDELRIYNRKLSETEVQELFKANP